MPLHVGVRNVVHLKIPESRRVSEPNKNKVLDRALGTPKMRRAEAYIAYNSGNKAVVAIN